MDARMSSRKSQEEFFTLQKDRAFLDGMEHYITGGLGQIGGCR